MQEQKHFTRCFTCKWACMSSHTVWKGWTRHIATCERQWGSYHMLARFCESEAEYQKVQAIRELHSGPQVTQNAYNNQMNYFACSARVCTVEVHRAYKVQHVINPSSLMCNDIHNCRVSFCPKSSETASGLVYDIPVASLMHCTKSLQLFMHVPEQIHRQLGFVELCWLDWNTRQLPHLGGDFRFGAKL